MGQWTGKWKSGFHQKCNCECGIEGGAEIYVETFDSEHLGSMQHDGETRNVKEYLCKECIAKFGKRIIVNG